MNNFGKFFTWLLMLLFLVPAACILAILAIAALKLFGILDLSWWWMAVPVGLIAANIGFLMRCDDR
jgi:hypothetical protein